MEHFSTLGDVTARRESNMRAKALVARAVAKALQRTFGPLQHEDVFGHIERVAGRAMAEELREKGTVPAGQLGHPTWGGPLTSERLFSSAFLDLVRPFTVIDRLWGFSALRWPC